MEEKQDGPEKSLFNSTERGQIQQPPAPTRDDRPAAEKYPPRDDKPGLYSLYDGDVHKDTFTTAAQAWEEFQKHGGKDVSIQPEFGGEILVIRRERTVENQVWSGERKEFDVKVSDSFKRDLVAEGRNPDNPREPLPAAPKREASHTVLDQYDAQQADPTAEQLIAREQGQQYRPTPVSIPGTEKPETREAAAPQEIRHPAAQDGSATDLERTVEQERREQQQADRMATAQAEANARERAQEQKDVAQETREAIDASARERDKQERESREHIANREQESRINVKRDGDGRQTQALENAAQAKQEPPRRQVDALKQALSPNSTSVQAMFAKGRVSAPVDTVPPEIKRLMAATQELHRAAPSGVPDALVRMFAASPPLSKPDAPSNSPSLSTLLDPPQRRHSLSH